MSKEKLVVVADLHIHTVASTHAFSTVHEIITAAQAKGLRMIGIADHGPAAPGGAHRYYFRNGYRIPKEVNGLQIRFGIEDDLIDAGGHLGLDVKDRMCLDYVMLGVHPNMWIVEQDVKTRTGIMIKALEQDPAIKIMTHLVNPWEQVELEPVIKTCKATNTCVELNNTKLKPEKDVIELLELTMKHQVPIVVNSDAHIAFEVGEVGNSSVLLTKIGYPEELVVNTSLEKIKQYLGI